jgi:hypothetical protein
MWSDAVVKNDGWTIQQPTSAAVEGSAGPRESDEKDGNAEKDTCVPRPEQTSILLEEEPLPLTTLLC